MMPGRNGAILLCLAAAVMWGLWWAPIRVIEAGGLHGICGALAMTAGALPAFLLAAARERGRGGLTAPAALGAGLCGAAVILYAAALGFTDVLRAVLLFYLAPAWSTAIECLFLGRRATWRSGLALGLCFTGVIVIFRGEMSLDGFNAGDLMALGSGLAWSVGVALIFVAPPRGFGTLAVVTAAGSLATGLAIAALAGEAAGAFPGVGALTGALPMALATGFLYLAPIILITMWGALSLPPATLSFLLTAEIVSGVASSAIFLDQRFGVPEAIGAVLVTLGALVEVMPVRLRSRPSA